MIGLGGAVLSFLCMALAVKKQWFSPVGVGLWGPFAQLRPDFLRPFS